MCIIMCVFTRAAERLMVHGGEMRDSVSKSRAFLGHPQSAAEIGPFHRRCAALAFLISRIHFFFKETRTTNQSLSVCLPNLSFSARRRATKSTPSAGTLLRLRRFVCVDTYALAWRAAMWVTLIQCYVPGEIKSTNPHPP